MKLHELKDVIFAGENEARSTLNERFGGNQELIDKFIESGKRIKITAKGKHKRNRKNKQSS